MSNEQNYYSIEPSKYIYIRKGYAKCPENYVKIYTKEKEDMEIAGFFSSVTDVIRVSDTIIITHHDICIHITTPKQEKE